MDKQSDIPDMRKLHLSDQDSDDVEDLFASPSSGATTQKHTPQSQPPSLPKTSTYHARTNSTARQNEQEARETKLRRELENIQSVNKTITSVCDSLTKAQENMSTVHTTVTNASTLLATWTRILSQTEHNQRLILNPNWGGASQDLEDAEGEALRREQEAERRVAEEQRRREEMQRRLEDEERRRAMAPEKSSRGRGRGSRGVSGSSRGYAGVGGQTARGRGTGTGTGTGRAFASGGVGSGIARSGSTRGRGRGLG